MNWYICQSELMIDSRPTRIYQDDDMGKVYRADDCLPLRRAVKESKVELEALARPGYPGQKLPPDALPSVSTVGYWDATADQDWGLDWHRNEGIEITFLETGTMHFAVDYENYMLLPGNLTVTRPWQPHRLGNPHINLGRLHWIIIDVGVRKPHQSWSWPEWLTLTDSDIDQLTTMLRQNEQHVWRTKGDVNRCFQKIGSIVRSYESEKHTSWLRTYVNELLLLLLDFFRDSTILLDESLMDTRRTVELFLDDIASHLNNDWSVNEMANQCGLGVTQFTHYCKQIVNTTPARYLKRLRLEKVARRLITEPDKSVTEIAFECGFTSSQYLSSSFRKHYGHPPREHRAIHQD